MNTSNSLSTNKPRKCATKKCYNDAHIQDTHCVACIRLSQLNISRRLYGYSDELKREMK